MKLTYARKFEDQNVYSLATQNPKNAPIEYLTLDRFVSWFKKIFQGM